jgi:hypothetical protein
MKQWAMLKRYFITIFLLSAISLNAMDNQERIDVIHYSDNNKIKAFVSSIWYSGYRMTTVIKDRSTGSFEVCATHYPWGLKGRPHFSAAEPQTVERLKTKIAEYEKQMATVIK